MFFSFSRWVCRIHQTVLCCITLAALVFSGGILRAEQPNILWLTTEDIGPELGCYGDPDAVTPNIDAFAKDALKYKTAWSNYPVCAPARTTIITGRYASSMAAGNMRSQVPLPADVVMFPKLLKEAGYYCTNNKKEDYNVTKPKDVWDESGSKAHYRKRAEGQPFFAVFNNTGTHESKIRTRPHEAVIDPASLTLPPIWPDLPEIREDFGQYHDNITKMDLWFQKHLDDLKKSGQADNTIVFFYGDHGAGMPGFKRYAGERGMRVAMLVHIPHKFRKLAPEYRPGGVSSRLVSFVDLAPTVLSLAGIEPLPSMEGQAWYGPHAKPAEEFLYGFRERMDEWVDLSHCLRDQQFQYTVNYMPHLPAGQPLFYQRITPSTRKWNEAFEAGKTNPVQSQMWLPRSPEELYDIQADPYGVNNLIDDPAYADQVARFRKAHRQKALSSPDFSFIPEPLSSKGYAGEIAPVFEAAQLASMKAGDAASDAAILDLLKDQNAAVRYWALMGCLQRGDRWAKQSADDFSAAIGSLKDRLSDEEPIVRVVAAEAIVASAKAPEEVKKQACATLLDLADMSNSGYLVAVAALNAIDRNRDCLTSEQIQSIASLPEKDPTRRRGTDDLEKLKSRFAQ